MSKYEHCTSRRSIACRCFLGIIMCSATLLQTGCIFDRCSNWYIGFTPGCNSCSQCANTTAATGSPAPAVQYTYDDGVAVGRQYAKNYGLTYGVGADDPLPTEIDGAGLGEAFETGCRDGINLQVREQPGQDQTDIEIAGEASVDNQVTGTIVEAPGYEPGSSDEQTEIVRPEYELRDQTPVQMFVKKSELQLPPVTPTGDKSLEKNQEANVLSEANAGPDVDSSVPGAAVHDAVIEDDAVQAAEQMFANSETLESAEPRVEAAPLRSATMDPAEASQLSEAAESTNSAKPAVQALPLKDSKPVANDLRGEIEPADNANSNDFIPRKTESTKASVKAEAAKPRKIILRAKPVPFRKPSPTERPVIEDPASSASPAAEIEPRDTPSASETESETATSESVKPETTTPLKSTETDIPPRDTPQNKPDNLIKLTATPNEQSIQPPPSTKQKTKSATTPASALKEPPVESSVLVDHLNGVGVELDPVPTLRAKTFTNPDNKSQAVPATNARYRFPGKASGIAPAAGKAQPAKAKTPAADDEVSSGLPTGQRLPAVGPDLENMMQSPFPSVPATSSPAEEPRKAEDETQQQYR